MNLLGQADENIGDDEGTGDSNHPSTTIPNDPCSSSVEDQDRAYDEGNEKAFEIHEELADLRC